MSDNEVNVPDRDTFLKLTEEFAQITDTNEALAQTFLQDHNWNLNKSVSALYDALKEENKNKNKLKRTYGLGSFMPSPNGSKIYKPNAAGSLYDPLTVQNLFGEGMAVTTEPPPRMKLLTWNLDGLDVKNLKKRTRAIIKWIQKHEPDIVFFQEVIPESAEYFQTKLPEYKCVKGGDEDYFTMTLLRVFTIFYDNHYVINYPNSLMGRNLLVTEAHMGKLKFQFLNTHLESTKDHSAERKNQLKIAFEKSMSFNSDYTVIFGGDLNLRDNEVCIPPNFFDLWEYCGSPSQFKYTWDMTKNTNNSSNFGKFKPRCRFDRVYFRYCSSKKTTPKHFALVGSEKVPQTQSFPSDHWGVVVLFDLNHSL